MSSRHYAKQHAADLEAQRAEDAGYRLGRILGVPVPRALEWHDGRFSVSHAVPLGNSGWQFGIRLTPTTAECHISPDIDHTSDAAGCILTTARPPAEWGHAFGLLRTLAKVGRS